MTANDTRRLTVQQDRRLIRHRWHSHRFVVAHVTAPEAASTSERQPVNLAFVIDRSGSMAGEPIRLAMLAVEEAIGRLKSSDRFSVVVYDNEIDTVVPGVYATPGARAEAIRALPSEALIVFRAGGELAVEVDGATHWDEGAQLRDEARDRWLKAQGVVVLRIPASRIYRDLSGVVDGVLLTVEELKRSRQD